MPKILIEEKDNTGVVQLDAITNTVYIPGHASKKIAPKIFYDSLTFSQIVGAETENEGYDTRCLSYGLAKRCLELGLYVVYEGIDLAEDADEEDKQEYFDEKFWDKLVDKTQYDIRFLTTGGYGVASQYMIQCAAKRGDCVALLDHPEVVPDYTDSGEESGTEHSPVEKVRRYFEDHKFDDNQDTYAAAFTPWFYTRNQTILANVDLESGVTEKAVPASFGYLFSYARSVRNNPSWYAVAGSFRGSISELVDVTYDYSEKEVEMLQARAVDNVVDLGTGDTPFLEGDNVGKAINAISYQGASFGYLIWGNRTFRKNDANKRTIATSFLNVRNLVSELKKVMFNTARKYTFEPNSDLLWINFQAGLTPTLNKMKSNNGIIGYRIEKLPTTAKARLRAKVTIIPIEAVEDFELTVELADSLDVEE